MIALFKQFCRYLLVGGTAAVTEWVTFFLCSKARLFYGLSTIIAFLIATLVNFLFGRKLAFAKQKNSTFKEVVLVYSVSLVGLIINLSLMFLFVTVLSTNELFSKILATGIVFFWNFFARKFLIYREK